MKHAIIVLVLCGATALGHTALSNGYSVVTASTAVETEGQALMSAVYGGDDDVVILTLDQCPAVKSALVGSGHILTPLIGEWLLLTQDVCWGRPLDDTNVIDILDHESLEKKGDVDVSTINCIWVESGAPIPKTVADICSNAEKFSL